MSDSYHISPDNVAKVIEICENFNNDPGELINILHKTQSALGFLPKEVQDIIGKQLKIGVAKVFGVVTFYSFFTMTPKGENPISICTGTACYVRGANKVLEEFQKQLNIEVGATTEDGKFSIDCLRCVGACGLAPVVLVGEKVYGGVKASDVKRIIAEYI
ncbi:MAG: NAD(P)H-dependent oxidoreductase subunit E [Candidatus Cloacimonadota bacterium]|nr:MAG: NAD(P)H-dependent oxidoreductase subunit E [Candidatus Cloacimonadota bacterium]PIE79575.1 MAG: NAD(P)H-dependent oxidoreductase subunit E [Candidatus Delongbacteria bacterium]